MKTVAGIAVAECDRHGLYTGMECPLCGPGGHEVVKAATAPPAIECDRTNWYPGPEKELHSLFESELIRRGISYIHARTDQKSTIANGWPDFSCFYTAADGICRACFVELKNKNGRTSKDQDAVIAELQQLNIPTLVTGNFSEAVEFVRAKLAIHQNSPDHPSGIPGSDASDCSQI